VLLPSSKPKRRLQDIVDNIGWILDDIEGLSEDEFLHNRTIQDAVLFRLLRISEAATKLGTEAEDMIPQQPWDQIRAFGNVLRHDYDSVALPQVWVILTRDLPSLMSSCREALTRLGGAELT
jgi:uncharacterized protein with HEPN domain